MGPFARFIVSDPLSVTSRLSARVATVNALWSSEPATVGGGASIVRSVWE